MSSGFRLNDPSKEAVVKKHILILLCILAWTGVLAIGASPPSAQPDSKELMIGIKIYAYSGGLPELFAEWESLGINTVFVSPDLAAQGSFRELARETGTALFLIFPIFFNPEELGRDPGLHALTDRGEKAKDDWVEFICPTRQDYLERRIASIKGLIEDLDPDGISLDFIRYFVFWEMVYPERTLESISDTCFDRSCLERFQRETGIRLPESLSGTADRARWILSKHRREWTDWKCGVIAGAARLLAEGARGVKPDIEISIHTVPWRQDDFGRAIRSIAGQDVRALAGQADMISPMCYWHMLKRTPPWVHEVVDDAFAQGKGRVIPSIQVGNAYLKESIPLKEFEEAFGEALKPPSGGIIFWDWAALVREPEKKAVLHAFLESRPRE